MNSRRRAAVGAVGAVGALGAFGAAYAWWEPTAVETTERSMTIAGLPLGLDGLRILHVSDTHFPASASSVARFLEAVWPLEYDLVCCTGDYVETSAGWSAAADALTQLSAPQGVYATLGAHDYLAPVRGARQWLWANGGRLLGRRRRFIDPQMFVDRLQAAGIAVLRNESRSLTIAGESVTICGAGDDSVGLADVSKAVSGAADGLNMLLTHSPDAALRLHSAGAAASGSVALILSGHTHGGQIRVPYWGAPVRHSRLVDRKRTAGVFACGGAQVVISRGFGTAIVPLRFGCRPEIGILKLRKG